MGGASRYQAIDIVKLYAYSLDNPDQAQLDWKTKLKSFYLHMDINGLAQMRRELQIGMADASTANLANDELHIFFAVLQKSIEKMAYLILKRKYPLPGDNINIRNNLQKTDPLLAIKAKEMKQKRDQEFMAFLKQKSF